MMMKTLKPISPLLLTLTLTATLFGCSGGGGGTEEPTPPEPIKQIIDIADCTNGMTSFQVGDEVDKTIEPTTLKMSYGDDGSQSGCVVSGAATIRR